MDDKSISKTTSIDQSRSEEVETTSSDNIQSLLSIDSNLKILVPEKEGKNGTRR
jgi:hypothetical protein